MPKLTIDNKTVDVPEGTSILHAAREAGVEIPTLCYLEGQPAKASCMLCVVWVVGEDKLVASCAREAEDGMVISTENTQVRNARKSALELLLGDHLGDCEAPCQSACPASLRIPLMLRQVRGGPGNAAATARRDLVLPATLGRICPAPCEKGCRRNLVDESIAIRSAHRYVADAEMDAGETYLPDKAEATGKHVAVVGAGPAGLSVAWELLQAGHGVTLFDDHDVPGGALRHEIDADTLSPDVVDAEAAAVLRLGAEFRGDVRVGGEGAPNLEDLRREFDAVAVAVGETDETGADRLGLEPSKNGINVDRRTRATSHDGVFAGGDCIRATRTAVRSIGDGKLVAASINQYLSGEAVTVLARPFSVHIGKPEEEELGEFVEKEASDRGRVEPSDPAAGFTSDEVTTEAERCLRCDCRKPVSCKLRRYSEQYGAKYSRYRMDQRCRFQQERGAGIIYEPGKCIACGICIQTTETAREPLGLTWIGRGFDVRVGVPLEKSLEEGLQKVAAECVRNCPTGALAMPEGEDEILAS